MERLDEMLDELDVMHDIMTNEDEYYPLRNDLIDMSLPPQRGVATRHDCRRVVPASRGHAHTTFRVLFCPCKFIALAPSRRSGRPLEFVCNLWFGVVDSGD